jgi:hypothetical protein
MRFLSARLRSFKIQTRLVFFYTIFALITVGVVIFFSYTQAVKSIQKTIEDELGVIAGLKMDNFDRWVEEQRQMAIFLADLPELRSFSGELLDVNSSEVDRAVARLELTDRLTIMVQRSEDFQDIQILDPHGIIAVSTIPNSIGLSGRQHRPFMRPDRWVA